MCLKAQYSVLFVLCFNWNRCFNSHHTFLVCLLVKEIIMIHIYTCIYTSLYTYDQFSEMTTKIEQRVQLEHLKKSSIDRNG